MIYQDLRKVRKRRNDCEEAKVAIQYKQCGLYRHAELAIKGLGTEET